MFTWVICVLCMPHLTKYSNSPPQSLRPVQQKYYTCTKFALTSLQKTSDCLCLQICHLCFFTISILKQKKQENCLVDDVQMYL